MSFVNYEVEKFTAVNVFKLQLLESKIDSIIFEKDKQIWLQKAYNP